jgi:anti-sigma factor RsiW
MPKPRSERRLAQDPPLGRTLNQVLPNQLGTELGTMGCLRMADKGVPRAAGAAAGRRAMIARRAAKVSRREFIGACAAGMGAAMSEFSAAYLT